MTINRPHGSATSTPAHTNTFHDSIASAPGVELDRLEADDGRLVVFNGPLHVMIERTETWRAETKCPPAHATASGPWSALRALGNVIADEVLRLVRQPTGRLPRHDVGQKGLFLGAVNLRASEIGLGFHPNRWLVGSIHDARFVPDHDGLGQIAIDPAIVPGSTHGKFFARVRADRGGFPTGPVERLVSAGSGRSLQELLEALAELVAGDDDAA